MFTILESLVLFMPEIVMVVGALCVLLIGAFGHGRIAAVIGICSMVLATLLVCSMQFNGAAKLFSGMMSLDAFVKFGKVLLLLASIVVTFLALSKRYQFEFLALLMLSTVGMMCLVSANSLMTLYLSLELMSLPLYIMASFKRDDSRSNEAGLKYFVLGSIASGLFLLGATFVYGFTGVIGFDSIYDYYVNLSAESDSVVVPIGFLVGVVLILVGMAFKVSAVPFHMWTPDVYQGAPTVVTAFLASAPKVAAMVILVRLLLGPFAELYVQWQQIILTLSVLSMFVGSLGAIMQSNFKRLLAYSSIGHVGFMLAGVSTTENEGLQGLLIYLTIYLSMTIAAFGALLLLRKDGRQVESIKDLSGLATTSPNMALALAILMFSMAGVPPTAGFFAKFYILMPLIKAQMYYVAVAFVIASVIAAFYYLKVVKVMYFDTTDHVLTLLASTPTKIVVCAGALFNCLYTIAPTSIINLAEVASIVLFQ